MHVLEKYFFLSWLHNNRITEVWNWWGNKKSL